MNLVLWSTVLISMPICLLLARLSHAQGLVLGADFQVNTYTTEAQQGALPIATTDGGFLVLWEGRGAQDGENGGIFGQRFDASATPLQGEFQINLFNTGTQDEPHVARNQDGSFVVVWHSVGQEGNAYGVVGRRLDVTGTPIASEFPINTYTTGNQAYTDVAATSDGGFVVTWSSDGQDGDRLGVFGQRFDSTATPIGTEFQINTYTTDDQFQGQVAANPLGGFVVVWAGRAQNDSFGVLARRFDASGTPVGTEFSVNGYTSGSQWFPRIEHGSTGDFIVVWQSSGQDNAAFPDYGVFARRIDDAGALVGTEFQVNSYVTGDQSDPVVAARDDGSFVVAWSGVGYTELDDVFGQRFDSSNTPVGSEFRINAFRGAGSVNLGIATTSGGSFLTTWLASGLDGSGFGVFASSACESFVPDADGDGLGDACDPCTSGQPIAEGARVRFELLPNEQLDNQRMRLSGEFLLPPSLEFADLDPLTAAFRLRIEPANGPAIVDVLLPRAAYADMGGSGWTRRGTKWLFRDGSRSAPGGLVRLALADRGRSEPGRIALKAKGRRGLYEVRPEDTPLQFIVTFGDPSSGHCAETDFAPTDCDATNLYESYSCRN